MENPTVGQTELAGVETIEPGTEHEREARGTDGRVRGRGRGRPRKSEQHPRTDSTATETASDRETQEQTLLGESPRAVKPPRANSQAQLSAVALSSALVAVTELIAIRYPYWRLDQSEVKAIESALSEWLKAQPPKLLKSMQRLNSVLPTISLVGVLAVVLMPRVEMLLTDLRAKHAQKTTTGTGVQPDAEYRSSSSPNLPYNEALRRGLNVNIRGPGPDDSN